ncbi:TerB family tellurite resistance protein [Candidatus Pelagibacter sp.]|nr:TerB family tellurite resistance protein [Candidatus Pelagibacter sp.]
MFFNKNKNNNQKDDLIKVSALLIHAAKIDENYTPQEEEIIKQALSMIGANKEDIEYLIEEGKKIEKDANHILDFTKQVKNMDNDSKIKIIKTLWRIIFSNNNADMYETNLMRRLAGLLYVDSKTMGVIKEQIKKENS